MKKVRPRTRRRSPPEATATGGSIQWRSPKSLSGSPRPPVPLAIITRFQRRAGVVPIRKGFFPLQAADAQHPVSEAQGVVLEAHSWFHRAHTMASTLAAASWPRPQLSLLPPGPSTGLPSGAPAEAACQPSFHLCFTCAPDPAQVQGSFSVHKGEYPMAIVMKRRHLSPC